jgi:hypothetical protein
MPTRIMITLVLATFLAALFAFPHSHVLAQSFGPNDRFVCGTNEHDEIWCTSYPRGVETGHWERIPGSLKQVVVGDGGHLWGVNRNGDIYYSDDFRSGAAHWVHLDGTAKEVSEGHGLVCIVNDKDKIWCADEGINTAHPRWRVSPAGANLKFLSVN